MQQNGDLEKYLRSPNCLDPSIEIKTLQSGDSLFGEELEMRKYNMGDDGRMVMLGVDYDGGKLSYAEASFYPAQFDTAQKGAQEYAALASIEKALTSYQAYLGDDLYISASGDDETFVRKVVQCMNGFFKS